MYFFAKRVKGMQVLNLIREFKMQRMKESDTVKEYSDRLLSIVNRVRLLGTKFLDSRIVQKILVTATKRFESTISSLENTKDLSSITLTQLLNALQAQEQRRLMRQEGSIEGALQAKLEISQSSKGKKKTTKGNKCAQTKGADNSSSNGGYNKQSYPPCQHCGRRNHPHYKCWRRLDVKCHKCN